MKLTIDISEEAKELLLQAWGDHLDQAALEALAVEGYRLRKFGTSSVRRLLGLPDRWTTERWLADRQVFPNYSLEDLEADRATLRGIFGPRPEESDRSRSV